MKKLLFLILFMTLLWPREAPGQQTTSGYFVQTNCDTINFRRDNTVLCVQIENQSGRPPGEYRWTGTEWLKSDGFYVSATQPAQCRVGEQWFNTAAASGAKFYACESANTWVAQGGAGGTSGHVIQDEGVVQPTKPTLNFTGTGVTVVPQTNSLDIVIPTPSVGAADPAANYVWTGTNSWRDNNFSILDNADTTKVAKFELGGLTTATTRTYSLPNATTNLLGGSDLGTSVQAFDSDLAALAANSTNGFWARTGAGTGAARAIGGTTGNITVVNGDGVLGPPVIDLGPTAVQTDISNTWSTGDQSFKATASVTPPNAAGAAPTIDGRFALNTSTSRLVYGVGGSTFIIAHTGEIQPLSVNLTQLAALTPTLNQGIIYNGSIWTTLTFPDCLDTAGKHWNFDASTRTIICGTSSTGGISGGTIGTLPKYATATSLTPSIFSEAAGIGKIGGGLEIGDVSTNYWNPDPTLVTGAKTWAIQNISGIPLVATTEGGAITDTNIAVFKTTAGITRIVNGGAAGTGTWTNSSTNTGDNKTLVAVGAGGTNTITVPIRAYWDAGTFTFPSTSTCTTPALTQINSGPSVYITTCTDASTSAFEGSITLAQDVVTVTFTLTVNDVDSSSQHFAGDFSAMCRNNGTTVNNTWGTSQSVDITMTTANNNYTGTTSAVTANGSCTAGATFFWRFVVNTTPFTDNGNARVIGVLMKQNS